MGAFTDRFRRAWNVFMNRDAPEQYEEVGAGYSIRPDRPKLTRGVERSIVTSIYNRIAMDVAAIDLKHVQTDADGRYLSDMDSGLNYCLTTEANIDQTGRALRQDIVMSMLDEGAVAVVPVDTETVRRPEEERGEEPRLPKFRTDILTLRTAKIVCWYPAHVRVRIYNDRTGQQEELLMPKEKVAIIENPLYSVMNEPNSTMQRLIRKLILLDSVDEQTSSGKLNIIVQLPYLVKTEARKAQAESRRKEIEEQLASSKYGIAYTDGTEHVQQLNRPLENNLMGQIEYLTNLLYGQLGITDTIMDGTADERTMLNYHNRTVEPILSAISDEIKRKFLTREERKTGETIVFFRDPFRLVPVQQLAEISDKMTRNEIMTSNEVRQLIGMKPSDDPNADVLRNKNLNQSSEQLAAQEEQQAQEAGTDQAEQQAYDTGQNGSAALPPSIRHMIRQGENGGGYG